MLHNEKTEKQRIDETDRDLIKAAILKSAENSKLSPQSLSDGLIAAFEMVNKHYETGRTVHIAKITFNVIKGA